MRNWIKVLLSILICFHLLAILVLPNPNSILSRELPWLTEYGNLLFINTTWRFFSPNPLIRTVEYRTYRFDEDDNVVSSTEKSFPSADYAWGERETYNRTLNFAMIASSRAEWAQQLLGPVLCRQNPQADEITVTQIRRDFYALEKARLMGPGIPLFELKKQNLTTVVCDAKEGGE